MYPTARMEQALADNPDLIDVIWRLLNQISAEDLLGEGRVYGGGLWKLEPSELANVPLPELAAYLPESVVERQLELSGV